MPVKRIQEALSPPRHVSTNPFGFTNRVMVIQCAGVLPSDPEKRLVGEFNQFLFSEYVGSAMEKRAREVLLHTALALHSVGLRIRES